MDWEMLLKYLQVILTWPVAFTLVTLMVVFRFHDALHPWLSKLRIHYGEITVSSEQAALKAVEGEKPLLERPPLEQSGPKKDDTTTLSEETKQWRANAYLWEYRYLNLVLVRHTQQVLDWFFDHEGYVELEVATSFWMQTIQNPEERKAVLDILTQHHLIQVKGSKLSITPKGREYVTLRGRFPAAPVPTIKQDASGATVSST